MNAKDFIRLGIPLGEATRRATDFVSQFILRGGDKTKLEEEIKAIVANPALFAEDPMRKELAKAIVNAPPPPRHQPKQRSRVVTTRHQRQRQPLRRVRIVYFPRTNPWLAGGHLFGVAVAQRQPRDRRRCMRSLQQDCV